MTETKTAILGWSRTKVEVPVNGIVLDVATT